MVGEFYLLGDAAFLAGEFPGLFGELPVLLGDVVLLGVVISDSSVVSPGFLNFLGPAKPLFTPDSAPSSFAAVGLALPDPILLAILDPPPILLLVVSFGFFSSASFVSPFFAAGLSLAAGSFETSDFFSARVDLYSSIFSLSYFFSSAGAVAPPPILEAPLKEGPFNPFAPPPILEPVPI